MSIPPPLRPFEGMDIYLLDQLLKGRIPPTARVLDAGAGRGRNAAYFLLSGSEVFAVDSDPEMLQELRNTFGPQGALKTLCLPIEEIPASVGVFDLVICNAVLHFARDRARAEAMVARLHQALAPGGIGFFRFATAIGLSQPLLPVMGRCEGWVHLPDGSERFLLTESDLATFETRYGLRRIEPLKTTVVQNLRAMTTWVVQR